MAPVADAAGAACMLSFDALDAFSATGTSDSGEPQPWSDGSSCLGRSASAVPEAAQRRPPARPARAAPPPPHPSGPPGIRRGAAPPGAGASGGGRSGPPPPAEAMTLAAAAEQLRRAARAARRRPHGDEVPTLEDFDEPTITPRAVRRDREDEPLSSTTWRRRPVAQRVVETLLCDSKPVATWVPPVSDGPQRAWCPANHVRHRRCSQGEEARYEDVTRTPLLAGERRNSELRSALRTPQTGGVHSTGRASPLVRRRTNSLPVHGDHEHSVIRLPPPAGLRSRTPEPSSWAARRRAVVHAPLIRHPLMQQRRVCRVVTLPEPSSRATVHPGVYGFVVIQRCGR
eukprot:TRINITY_DN65857_c0_g1_i1.p2 TRINITY_DN65857_c0_g1~~TRINITY_DN65857_c0_g1_i1.p2  ORF type:complete len:383 (+),score=46.20 TRINITY_DN65857_c0_g1_i1:121-1149(+)